MEEEMIPYTTHTWEPFVASTIVIIIIISMIFFSLFQVVHTFYSFAFSFTFWGVCSDFAWSGNSHSLVVLQGEDDRYVVGVVVVVVAVVILAKDRKSHEMNKQQCYYYVSLGTRLLWKL